jgi:hypothetical protein
MPSTDRLAGIYAEMDSSSPLLQTFLESWRIIGEVRV